jgi:hypothetical protein
MKRFVIFRTVWAAGMAGVLASLVLPVGLAAAGLPAAIPAVATAMAVSTSGGFTSLAPARLLDTRIGVGATTVAVPAHGTVHLQGSRRW